MKQKPIVIYHANCMDGFTAMWAAHLYFDGEIEAIPARNGHDDRPQNVEGRDVYILDYAFPRDVLLEMKKQADFLIVLDHHKTSQEALEGLDFCIFDMERSGAGIAWDYFFNEPRPWLVDYVEDQDIWKWEHPDSGDICAYLNSQEKTLENWYEMYDAGEDEKKHAREEGRIINRVIDFYCEDTINMAQLCEFDGYEVPIVNAPFFAASKLLNKMCSRRLSDGSWPLFAISWHVNKYGQVKYSLRSADNPDTGEAFDVSVLAQKFGGGGHHKASAFRVKGVEKLVHKKIKPLNYLT